MRELRSLSTSVLEFVSNSKVRARRSVSRASNSSLLELKMLSRRDKAGARMSVWVFWGAALLLTISAVPYYKFGPLELCNETRPGAAAIGETREARLLRLLMRRKPRDGLGGTLSCRCRLSDSIDSAWISSLLACRGTPPSCAVSPESYLRRVVVLKRGYLLKVSLMDLLRVSPANG